MTMMAGKRPEGEAAAPAVALAPVAAPKDALGQWAEILMAADSVDELKRLSREVVAEHVDERAWERFALLAARWVELDPEAALAFCREQENGYYSVYLRKCVLLEWGVRDAAAVWAFLNRETEGSPRTGEMDELGQALLAEGPAVFWEWFLHAKSPLPNEAWIGNLDPTWLAVARAHPVELEAIAREMAGSTTGKEGPSSRMPASGLFAALAQVKAESDLAGVVEVIRSYPEAVWEQCLSHALRGAGADKPDIVSAIFGQIKSGALGAKTFRQGSASRVVNELAMTMSRNDPRAALDWLIRLEVDSSVKQAGVSGILGRCVAEGKWSPMEVIEYVESFGEDGKNFQSGMLSDLGDAISPAQLAEITKGLSGAEPDSVRGGAFQNLLFQWGRRDEAAAMSFVHGLENQRIRQRFYEIVLNAKLSQHEQGSRVLERFLQEVPPADRADIIASNMKGISNYIQHWGGVRERFFDGGAFADALAEAPAGQRKTEAVNRLFSQWGALEPNQAIAWIGTQEDGAFRAEAVEGVMQGWAQNDAWGASQWLAEQPRGPERDQATHTLAKALRDTEPDSAWTWAADMENAASRQAAREEILLKWRERDRAAAIQAVEGLADVSPEEKQRLIKMVTPNP